MSTETSRVGMWADHVSGELDPREVTRDEDGMVWLRGISTSGDDMGPFPAENYNFTKPLWNDHVTASRGAIYGVVTAQKRYHCSGHLNHNYHYIEKGERYVASALPPHDPEVNNDRWWHLRLCRNCCPIEYIDQVNKESK
jgi:hypothetical protein